MSLLLTELNITPPPPLWNVDLNIYTVNSAQDESVGTEEIAST